MTKSTGESMVLGSDNYFKSAKSTNELILRLGERQYDVINLVIRHANDSAKIPRSPNPFHIQNYIKQHVNRHENISNMRYTRQGKMLFTTTDPVCAAQLLSPKCLMDTPISTSILWENTTDRFLVFDIPTQTPLSELADEISKKNGIEKISKVKF